MSLPLREAYQLLLSDPNKCFVYRKGNCIEVSELLLPIDEVQVYPGSWNPFHKGHEDIYNAAHLIDGWAAFLEFSINRRGKDPVSYEEFTKILSQFDANYFDGVFLTNCIYFHEKAKVIGKATGKKVAFHIGYDTAIRLMNDHPISELEKTATFYVYDRESNSLESLLLAGVEVPNTFVKGELIEGKYKWESSTKIREEMGRTKS